MDRAVKRLGMNLRAARLERGWTQEDLAEAASMAPVQISRIERGVREIRLTTLTRLLHALDVEPGELLDGTY